MSRFVLTAQLQLQAPNNVQQVVRQIQQQLQGVTVNVQVQNSAQAQRQLQQVTQQTNAAASAADRMGKAFALSVRRFAAFSVANKAVGLLTSSLSKAVDEAIQFERQLIKVAQVTGKSIAQLKGLTREITNLATGFGVASSDLLNVSTVLSQAGLSAQDTTVALKTLAKAALAPNFDSISETAEGAIAILAQFQEGVGALERQLGSINAVAGAFAVEAGDLIDVIRRTGGVFKSSGGDLNELLALFTSVRATTRESAESIGTGLRTIFTRIQRPKTIEFLKQFGVELIDLNGKFVGPYEAIKRLSQALAGLGEGDLTFIRVAEELGGFRQIGKVLPLLQQFSTAQSALNVAQKAGSSLADDAAKAQLSLAIRIAKVREEFLALIRSVTETTTFQVMANTALTLASALIKIGEAIKPLLPLLATLAAIKFTQGIGTFIGGAMRGATSGRAYSTGGKVHHFARGGFVPGTGNRDTVPAMLQPGEFVIRKSSVNKIGAGNLAAMNSNKYATGGIVVDPNQIGTFFLRPEEGVDRSGFSLKGTVDINNPKVLKKLGISKGIASDRMSSFDNLTKDQQSKLLGFSLRTKLSSSKIFDKTGKLNLTQSARTYINNNTGSDVNPSTVKNLNTDLVEKKLSRRIKKGKATVSSENVPISGSVSSYFPGRNDLVNSNIANIVSENTKKGLFNTVLKSIDPALESFNNPILSANKAQSRRGAKRIANDANALKTVEGFVFEGLTQSLTGAKLAGNQSNFDFPSSSISSARASLKAMFADKTGEGIDNLVKADAKRSNTDKVAGSLITKIKNDINANKLEGIQIQKFAIGGEAQKVATLLGKGKAIADSWWTGMFAGNNILFDWGRPTVGFKIPTGEEIPIDQNLRKVLRERAQREWFAFVDQRSKERDAKAPKTKTRDVFNLTPEQIEKAKKAAEAKKAQDYVNRTSGLTRDVEDYGRRKRRPEEYLKRMRGFATGGGVGTDTVPALLTPGEFVVNRSSAKKIGYGNLSRMNKVGKYAKGGVVKHFATGGAVSPTIDPVVNSGSSGGLLQQIAQERARLETENNKRIDAIYKKSAQDLIKTFSDKYAAIKADTSISNSDKAKALDDLQKAAKAAAQSLKEDYQAQKQASSNQAAVQAKQNVVNTRTGGQDFLKAKTAASKGQFNVTDFGAANFDKLSESQRKYIMVLQQQSTASAKSAASDTAESAASNKAAAADEAESKSSSKAGGLFNNMGFGLSIAASSLSAMLPPLDENSGLLLKMSHGLLGVVTSIAATIAALEAFGLSLNKQTVMEFFRGGGLGKSGSIANKAAAYGRAGTAAAGRGLTNAGSFLSSKSFPGSQLLGRAATSLGSTLGSLSATVGTAVGSLATIAGPVALVVGGLFVLKGALDAVAAGYKKESEDAIKAGNIDLAGERARQSSLFTATGVGTVIGGTIGAVGGAIAGAGAGGIGALPGAVAGGSVGAGIGGTIGGVIDQYLGGASQAEKIARLRAGEAKSMIELEKASTQATRAMIDFNNGSKTALEVLDSFKTANISEQRQKAEFDKTIGQAAEGGGKAGRISGILRATARVGTLGIAGLAGLESRSQVNQRVTKENVDRVAERRKTESEVFSKSTEARNASIRSLTARGLSRQDIETELKSRGVDSVSDTRARATAVRAQAKTAFENKDLKLAQELDKYAEDLENRASDLDQAFNNIEKEVKRQKELFNAMNLGLRPAIATSTAMSSSLERLQAGFEVGGSSIVSDLSYLETALSSAAQAMDPKDISKAIDNVGQSLSEFGVSDTVINKFKGNMEAFTEAQRNYNSAVGVIKKDLEESGKLTISPQDFQKKLADELTKGMADGDAKKNLKSVIEGMELSETEVNDILGGNLSVLGDKLSETQKKQIEDIQKIAAERQKAEQILIDFLKKRIDAERNFVEAQQQAIDLIMEGRDVQAKYGGPAVSYEERRSAITARSNVQSNRLGLSNLTTGDPAELRKRNAEIRQGISDIETQRRQRDGMQGREGVELDEKAKDLQKAQQEQVNTIRSLIKLEEEELKIIQEKNKLERSSLESLMKGDIEGFFKQQAAVGAQAAIATGNKDIQSFYGAEALGMAAEDLRRQQEAGVQSVFGQQLAGPGGLVERGAGAALGAFGVRDQRSAQVFAGTTPEEEASKARLRALGGELGAAGDLGADIASMQLQTATMQINEATIDFEKVRDAGNKAAKEGQTAVDNRTVTLSRGGMVYASKGIFVPRGTDTIPAMLTPGEFVVNRAAVQRGNNLQILQTMNRGSSNASQMASDSSAIGMSGGGPVRYRYFGSHDAEMAAGSGDQDSMSKFVQALNNFNSKLAEQIQSLNSVSISLKLDSTNVNVNLNNVEFLNTTIEAVKDKVLQKVEEKIGSMRVGNDGALKNNPGPVNRSMGN